MSNLKKHTYYLKGMHCASCEILIEKKLLEDFKEIKSADASLSENKVVIEYEGNLPKTEILNKAFEKENYYFSNNPFKQDSAKKSILTALSISFVIISVFIILKNLGISELINVNSTSSLAMFFGLGLAAGISSCAALVGGLILSMSKQWTELYSSKNYFSEKIQPHIMFNSGRIISYAFFGAALGLIGQKLQISLSFTSILVIGVSIIMAVMGLQMLGFKRFQKIRFGLPKIIARKIADKHSFEGKYMPFLMGASTFFLPCGFTITAQGIALLSGSPIKGSLIMLFFALGTLPMLLIIGLSSVRFSKNQVLSNNFLKTAGILVLFFAVYNINSQLNVLGFYSLDNLNKVNDQSSFAPIENNIQVIKMTATSRGYSPNYFIIKTGMPVRWEITDLGTSGCTNAVISKDLFEGEINLTPGKTSIKEFTIDKPGRYKFSCWMGMVSGTIEAVEPNSSASVITKKANEYLPEQNKDSGCSCGVEK
ncbi:MAG: sulfite exporter TauE/SafE family protein [Candidatus Pacebacteria bacterium]|nr:sulfite exporter TauE/SafE family protein [Candidatus Paceibacterota bacterium]